MTDSDKRHYVLQPDEINFDLKHEELFGYLDRIRPGSGTQCPVCHANDKWTAAFTHRRDEVTGKTENIALPDNMTNEKYYSFRSADDRVSACATDTYSMICANCGLVLRFNAGLVAGRTAAWKKELK